MVSGTYVLTDSIDQAFDTIFTEIVRQGTDAVDHGQGGIPICPTTVRTTRASVRRVAACPRSASCPSVAGRRAASTARRQLIGNDGKAIDFGGAPHLGFSIDRGESRFNPLTLVEGDWPRRRTRS